MEKRKKNFTKIKILGAENALKNGMRGTFTWKSWVGDVALSGSTVLVTFGAATFAAWGTTRSVTDFQFKSLIKFLIQYPTQEILNRT